jgi:hypothetical protein
MPSSWVQELSVVAASAGVKKNLQKAKVGDGQEWKVAKVAQEEVLAGGGGGEGMGGGMTEYERQRLANIRRNAELLKDLGIAQNVADLRRVTPPSLKVSREVCVCVCVCVCVVVCVCVCVCVRERERERVCVCIILYTSCTHTHTHIHIYCIIYLLHMCVCVCVCVCVRACIIASRSQGCNPVFPHFATSFTTHLLYYTLILQHTHFTAHLALRQPWRYATAGAPG